MEFDDKLRMKCSQWQCLNTSPVQVWLSEGKLVPERFRGNTGDNDDNDSHRYKYHYLLLCLLVWPVWVPRSLLVSLSATLIWTINGGESLMKTTTNHLRYNIKDVGASRKAGGVCWWLSCKLWMTGAAGYQKLFLSVIGLIKLSSLISTIRGRTL